MINRWARCITALSPPDKRSTLCIVFFILLLLLIEKCYRLFMFLISALLPPRQSEIETERERERAAIAEKIVA